MNAGDVCSGHFLSGSNGFDQYRKVFEHYRNLGLSGSVFKTTSGAEFRCKATDRDKIGRLSCGKCNQHVMEGRPLKDRQVIDRAILVVRPKDTSMIRPLKDHRLSVDFRCIEIADPYQVLNHDEDEELTDLSRSLTVHCAKQLPPDQSGFHKECGQRVKLSELPQHFHDPNGHPDFPPPAVEPQGEHPAAEGLGSPGNFSERSVGSEGERSLVNALLSQLLSSNKKIESLEAIIKTQASEISQLRNTVDSLSNRADMLSLDLR